MQKTMEELRKSLHGVDTAAICDADKMVRVMSPRLACRSKTAEMCGRAYTVRCREDFFAVIRGLQAADPGDVLVVDGGGTKLALAGELVTRTAEIRGLAGIIVDGGYRDLGYVATSHVPIFSTFVSPMAADTKHLGELQITVSCGGTVVHPGDVIVADAEGIVVLAPESAHATIETARHVKATERNAIDRFDDTRQMPDLLNADEHARLLKDGRPSTLRFVDPGGDTHLALAGNA